MSGGRRHKRNAGRWAADQAIADAEGQTAVLVGRSPGGGETWRRGQLLLVVPGPAPDDAPTDVREGITRRRLVATEGRCPCGARPRTPRPGILDVAHTSACPGGDRQLAAAVERWKGHP